MKHRFQTFCFFSLAATCPQATAQTVRDTTLAEYRIREKHAASSDTRINDFSPGLKLHAIDTATLLQYQSQSLATVVARQTAAFVKSYGFNGLATLNLRGASAAQSGVYWNGIPIQNAASGVADISTIPISLVDRVSIQYGGSASLLGSGNVGGALLLESASPLFDSFHRSLKATFGVGSFGQIISSAGIHAGNRQNYVSCNMSVQSAWNDFPYIVNGKTVNQSNSRLVSGSSMVTYARKLSRRDVLSLSMWFQQYEREIPPALFEQWSAKKQADNSLRTMAEWKRNGSANLWYVRSSFIRDVLHYTDPSVLLDARNVAFQYFQEVGFRQRFKWGQILLFSPQQFSWMGGGPSGIQAKAALAGACNTPFFDERLKISVSARAEMIHQRAKDGDSTKMVGLPGINTSYTCFDWLTLRVSVQRTYRVPTLNELFYQPGGNIALKPEQGWIADAGYQLRRQWGKLTAEQDVTVFDRSIKDWIVWLGGAIWTPHNLARVHSRGVETENKLTITAGNWRVYISAGTAYVLATTTESYLPFDGSIGKQIPYSPRYNGQGNLGFSYKRLYLNLNQTYTGYRFITTDESQYLLPYYTTNIQIRWSTHFFHHLTEFSAQCNNLLNLQYQVVGNRPMPGTNWLASIKLNLL